MTPTTQLSVKAITVEVMYSNQCNYAPYNYGNYLSAFKITFKVASEWKYFYVFFSKILSLDLKIH